MEGRRFGMRFFLLMLFIFGMNLFGLNIREIEKKYDPTEIYLTNFKISSEDLGKNSTRFCLIRHAPTEANLEGIVQGKTFRKEGGIVSNEEIENEFEKLRQIHIEPETYSGTGVRYLETLKHISDGFSVNQTFLFDEQDLGIFEGMKKNEVFANKYFWEMTKNPCYKFKNLETGYEVLNRLLFGIDNIAESGKFIGICTSQCAINWFLKWITGNYEKFLK